jgi:nitrite reductase/ring-hydroxylating ferredoxin subunit
VGSDLVVLAALADLDDAGDFHPAQARGSQFAIFRHQGAYYAIRDECPHEECLFSEFGIIDGGVIECSCHSSEFDAATGKLLGGPAWSDARIYPLAIVDGMLAIDMGTGS